jgi:hypothetical protein
MKIKTKIVAVAAAIAAVSSGSSFAYADGGSMVTLTPSAAFASSARGEFNDTRNSSLNSSSLAGVSLTNVAISFSFGAIRELSTTLNRDSHFGPSAPTTSSFYTLTSQMLAGRTTLSTGPFSSKASTPGLFNGETSYASNMSTPTGSQPETLAMLLASLGLMGAIAVRRIKANAD